MGGPQAPKIFNLQRIQRDYMLILLAPGLPAGPEHLACCCCRLTCHIAASSPVPWACARRLISRMTSSRSEYHCSSLRQPALQRLPHFLSSTSIDGWPCRPTVHSCQSASTVLTVRHIRCFGGSRSSCSCSCSGGLGEWASGVAWAEAYVLDTVRGEGSSGGGGSSCSCWGASSRNVRLPEVSC
jgi:hypothetical protein